MKLFKRILNYKLFTYHMGGYVHKGHSGCVELHEPPKDVTVTIGELIRWIVIGMLYAILFGILILFMYVILELA